MSSSFIHPSFCQLKFGHCGPREDDEERESIRCHGKLTLQCCFLRSVVLMGTDFSLTVVLGSISNVSGVSTAFPIRDTMKFPFQCNLMRKQ